MIRQTKDDQGFSLIEVMVTLVLLTIGMLGLVAMQGRGIQYTTDAAQRNNALMLANEAMEMIRANPDHATSYHLTELPEPDQSNCNIDFGSAEIDEQLSCWAARVAILLPEAENLKSEFRICRSDAPKSCNANGAAYMVQVAWRAAGGDCMDASPEAGNDPSICRFHLQGEL